MKIYTKTGDSGLTGLVGGQRIAKTSLRINAIGEVDELNAHIGLVRIVVSDKDLGEILKSTQSRLFDLGSELACLPDMAGQIASLNESHVATLEQSMDLQSSKLPALRNFILPAGTESAARLHVARCVCRRAERAVLALDAEQGVRRVLIQYLNRLSDWLFVAARTANHLSNVQDVEWQKLGS